MKVQITAPQFSINLNDVLKGLKMAVLLPVLTIIYTSIQAGSFHFDWKAIGLTAAGGFIAYIIKNFFDQPAAVVKDPETVQALKNGESVEVKKSIS
jgi:hypothetical protein